MKIKRLRRPSGADIRPYRVTGPAFDKLFPTEGSAIARALDLALDTGRTHYVHEYENIIGFAKPQEPRAAQFFWARRGQARNILEVRDA